MQCVGGPPSQRYTRCDFGAPPCLSHLCHDPSRAEMCTALACPPSPCTVPGSPLPYHDRRYLTRPWPAAPGQRGEVGIMFSLQYVRTLPPPLPHPSMVHRVVDPSTGSCSLACPALPQPYGRHHGQDPVRPCLPACLSKGPCSVTCLCNLCPAMMPSPTLPHFHTGATLQVEGEEQGQGQVCACMGQGAQAL